MDWNHAPADITAPTLAGGGHAGGRPTLLLRASLSVGLLGASLLVGGCASTASEPTRCELAAREIEACVATTVETPFSAECNTEEAQRAGALLDQLERAGCDGPAGGKADGFFCGFWDPLGWCDPPLAALGPEPEGEPTAFPILLAHGFNTSTTNFWRFNDVDVALAADGHEVVLGSAPPFDGPDVRASHLAEQVDALLADSGAERVNLVCFSQGGVDCRYLVSPNGLDYGDRVASVTTISSPHRGTYVADAAIAALPDADSAVGGVVDLLASWYGGTFSELAEDSHFIDAMTSMSEASMERFNEEILDHPDVYYQSWAGFSYVGGFRNPRDTIDEVCRDQDGVLQILWHEGKRDIMDPLLVGGALFTAHGTELRPNDGVSTVESAHWGVFRGCIPADHLDQVGQIRDRTPNRRTGFDYLRFYRNIAYDLSERGF